MAAIRQLEAHVANLIAAGEVVERPASVVKELVENAIDAGASALTVEIQRGGMSLIRVTDNGCGIPADEVEVAFLRHATSKLSCAQDLEAIGTLGFRGEALAAIAAVSRLELLTRTAASPLGTALFLEGGVLREREESGCPEGTTMLVRDLFFNTPARLKFMKRDSAEGAAVFALVQRVALSHPHVSIKFLRDGKQELLTPGDGKLSSVLYNVFGRDFALGFTELSSKGEDISVTGFVSLPACCRGTRGYQHFIVNGRPIRSPLLAAAVEEAYQNQKMVGKFPACVLHVSVRPNSVDVNVHPAKTEVKFLSDRNVFDAVYYAVRSALEGEGRHPLLTMEAPNKVAASVSAPQKKPESMPIIPKGSFSQMNTQQFRDSAQPNGSVPLLMAPPRMGSPVQMETKQIAFSLPEEDPMEAKFAPPISPAPGVQEEKRQPVTIAPKDMSREAPKETDSTIPKEDPQGEAPPTVQPEQAAELPWRIAGEVMDTYLMVEQGESITFIDKHAAHERMHFDRMQREDYAPMAQSLLEPILLKLPPEESEALERNLARLKSYGFLLEPFGGDALMLRELPTELSPVHAEETLSELARAFLTGKRTTDKALRDQILHTLACKAAIKGGQKSATEELAVVAKAVMNGEVKYCPHGRPVAIVLTRAQLERRFGRA